MSLCDIAAHMPVLTEYARNASFVLELGVGQGDGSTVALVQGLMESLRRRIIRSRMYGNTNTSEIYFRCEYDDIRDAGNRRWP